ncbi:hypothetical protein LguiA_025317 [Lonicera macranthoides]
MCILITKNQHNRHLLRDLFNYLSSFHDFYNDHLFLFLFVLVGLLQIVVHFTASWCMPSVAMNSFFEELASIHQDKLFLTVDVDDVKEVATKYGIKAMPTFLVMKEGVEVEKVVGANPTEVKKRIEGLVEDPTPISVVQQFP